MIGRRRFLAVAAAGLTGAAGAGPLRWRGRALGAEVALELHGPRAVPALAAARAALAEVEALFSLYDPGSTLSRLNAAGGADDLPPAFMALVAQADRVHAATEGLFDPTIQPLWRALAEGRDPGPARRAVGWQRVVRGPAAVRLAPGQALSFNGIAQGYAADRVTAALRAEGLTRALVDMGEHRGLSGPWRLALEDPAAGRIGTRTFADGAVATSSPAALRLGAESHILHPLGGLPRWSTVSVEAPRAALADGVSTALCLAPLSVAEAVRAGVPELGRITLIDGRGDVVTL